MPGSPENVLRAVRVADRYARTFENAERLVEWFRSSLARFRETFARYGKEPHTGLIPARDLVPVWNSGREVSDWILQTRSIPAGKAKAVEMAARTIRGNIPKDIPSWYEKNNKRFDVLLEAADWSERSSAGEVEKVGNITVHNTIGASPGQFKEIQELVANAEKVIHSVGFGTERVLYGNVFVVGQLKQARTAAWYEPETDDIFVRITAKQGGDDLSSTVHEFGHRLWDKFLSRDSKLATHRLFSDLRFARTPVDPPKPGELLSLKIQGIPKPLVESVDLRFVNFVGGGKVPLDTIMKELRIKATFPSRYAATNPEEFFAECFAYFALGKLKPDLKERFEAVLKA